MAKAGKAPMDHYKRTHYVSVHAVEQLRDRIGDKHSLTHRNDADLMNAIDEAVNIGLKTKENIKRFTFDNKPQLGVDVSEFFGFPLRAIISKNDKSDSPYQTAVVTILTTGMAIGPEKGGASLGDAISPELHAALRAAVSGVPQAKSTQKGDAAIKTPAAPPSTAHVRTVVERPSKVSTRNVSADRRLITYLKEGTTEIVVEEFAAPGDLRNRIFEFHQKGRSLDEITVWRPSRASIAIALDFEET